MVAVLYLALRILVVSAFAFALVVAITHWMVRERKLAPFGAWARFIRKISDPILRPIERRLIRSGGNPQQAPAWLVGLTLVLGLVLLWLYRWIVETFVSLLYLSSGNPKFIVAQVIHWSFAIIQIALIIRVIGSWIGATPYTRWMRPFVALTEWLLAPLRRFIPPFGMIDITPLVAYFLLILAERAAMTLILG